VHIVEEDLKEKAPVEPQRSISETTLVSHSSARPDCNGVLIKAIKAVDSEKNGIVVDKKSYMAKCLIPAGCKISKETMLVNKCGSEHSPAFIISVVNA
jgi:hypothetical protein